MHLTQQPSPRPPTTQLPKKKDSKMPPAEDPPSSLSTTTTASSSSSSSSSHPPPPPSEAPTTTTTTTPTGPHPPPAAQKSTDELLRMLNSTPLFMTDLDLDPDPDEQQQPKPPNIELEAMRALAHEGSAGERARGWRERGNEVITEGRLLVKRRGAGKGAGVGVRWADAREYYGRALGALREAGLDRQQQQQQQQQQEEEEEPVSPSERREIEEACYVNRALCNLELRNYGSCTRDCAAALRLNPRNVKALYRSATACLALDKLAAATDGCARALALEPGNAAAAALQARIEARRAVVEREAAARREREERRAREAAALRGALAQRGIRTRRTAEGPPGDVEDAVVKLDEAEDAKSVLSVPVLLMYPTHAQTDLVKAFKETETLAEHLEYILPLPWDKEAEFAELGAVECFMDTVEGGMVKVGKKVPLGKVLGGGKVELVDGLGRIYVLPKGRVAGWVAEVKSRRRRGG